MSKERADYQSNIDNAREPTAIDMVGLYLLDLGEITRINERKERELGRLIQFGKRVEKDSWSDMRLSPEEQGTLLMKAEEARHILFLANAPLAISLAKRRRGSSLPFEDLIQAANLGLMKAVDKFDPEKGTRFSTYAGIWICSAIQSAIAYQGGPISVPKGKCTMLKQIRELRAGFNGQLTDEQVAKQLASKRGDDTKGIKDQIELVEEIRRLDKVTNAPVSLNMPFGNDNNNLLEELIPDDRFSLEDLVVRNITLEDTRRYLEMVLRSLDDKRAAVVTAAKCGLYRGAMPTQDVLLFIQQGLGGKFFKPTAERLEELEEQVEAIRVKFRRCTFTSDNEGIREREKIQEEYDNLREQGMSRHEARYIIIRSVPFDRKISLELTGYILGMTRERIRQLELNTINAVKELSRIEWQ